MKTRPVLAFLIFLALAIVAFPVISAIATANNQPDLTDEDVAITEQTVEDEVVADEPDDDSVVTDVPDEVIAVTEEKDTDLEVTDVIDEIIEVTEPTDEVVEVTEVTEAAIEQTDEVIENPVLMNEVVEVTEQANEVLVVAEPAEAENAGAQSPYNYNLTLQPRQTRGETLYVDIMLSGDINYTQVIAEIAFNSSLLQYEGYEDLQGWVAACAPVGTDKVSIRSVATYKATEGMPCSPAIKIVTLKFSAIGSGGGSASDIRFNTLVVTPPAGYIGATTAPSQGVSVNTAQQ